MLTEKLIMINNGAKYGQIVFLVGGAGSGKGFAISQYMEGQKFRVRDVDEWKKLSQKLSVISKRFSPTEIMAKYGDKFDDNAKKIINDVLIKPKLKLIDLTLSNPDHVFVLHIIVHAIGLKDRTLENLLMSSPVQAKKGILDNIMFDITGKNLKSIEKIIPFLLDVGYVSENIHIVWVLTDFNIAVQQQKNRERTVPADIMLTTHEGAALTLNRITRKGIVPKGLNGSIYVVLGGHTNAIIYRDDDRKAKSKKELKNTNVGNKSPYISLDAEISVIIKDFKYVEVKKSGKTIDLNDKKLQAMLYQWVIENIPKTKNTKQIWNNRER